MAARKFKLHEVLQISETDCGPAALTAFARGYGLSVDYYQIRQYCQTNADGTSYSALVEVAEEYLQLPVTMSVMPLEHLVESGSEQLPAITMFRVSGTGHVVLVAEAKRARITVMDPGLGTHIENQELLASMLYPAVEVVEAADWREYAGSDAFTGPLRRRIEALGVPHVAAERILATALEDPGWRSIARLDAATRHTQAMSEKGLFDKAQAQRVLETAFHTQTYRILDKHWYAREIETEEEEQEEEVELWGAYAIALDPDRADDETMSAARAHSEQLAGQAVKSEKAQRPWRNLMGRVGPNVMYRLFLISVVAGGVAFAEAVLFRALLDERFYERTASMWIEVSLVIGVFFLSAVAGTWAVDRIAFAVGMRLGADYRMELRRILDLVPPQFYESRSVTDMTQRFHVADTIAVIPMLFSRNLRMISSIVLATLVMLFISPYSAAVLLLVVGGVWAVTHYFYRRALIADYTQRNAEAQTTRIFQHAVRARTPLKAHAAENVILVEHERLLSNWMRLYGSLLTVRGMSYGGNALLGAVGMLLVTYIELSASENPLSVLVVLYWYTLAVANAEQVATFFVGWMAKLTTILIRVLEYSAIFEYSPFRHGKEPTGDAPPSAAVAVELDNVSFISGGQVILEEINLTIDPGCHVAVVGRSGSGKSILASLILHHKIPTLGEIRFSGRTLDVNGTLEHIRQTVWVDPAVHLWNTSLLQNLFVGKSTQGVRPETLYDQLGLMEVVARLDQGGSSSIGEEGKLLSGGEGQRVRFGRVLTRHQPGLIVMDEAFRGLDLPRRARLLELVRKKWRDETMVYVTHYIEEALEFDRVLVVDSGRAVEYGPPEELLAQDTFFRRMLHLHHQVQAEWHNQDVWRHIGVGAERVVVEEKAKHEPG